MYVTDAPCPPSSTPWSIDLGEGRGSGIISSTYPDRPELDPIANDCNMVITGVPPGASLGVDPLENLIDIEGVDSNEDLLYISKGGSRIANLYKRTAPPLILRLPNSEPLNFHYTPDAMDIINSLRFVIQISGKKRECNLHLRLIYT